jgi:hypothetical protein
MNTSCAALLDDENAPQGSQMTTEIERFLKGETNGSVLFEALYGHIVEEPIPPRLLAMLRSGQSGEVVPLDRALKPAKS